jgi:hypothetical protein
MSCRNVTLVGTIHVGPEVLIWAAISPLVLYAAVFE